MIELKDDKLGRREFLDNIFKLLSNFGNQGDKGLTIILNGQYGIGKTTLLNFIEEKNQGESNFNIIRYNAWENNTFENPLIPLLYCISKLESKEGLIKKGTKNVLKKIPKIVLGTLANTCKVDLTSLADNESFFDDYDEYKESFEKLKNILKEYCANKKTVFLVDELDRCLPEYQIKVLESIYHLLNIPNLITVIALDKEQLECSIKNTFGDNQNTYGYLSKFIDYEIELLEGNTYTFIKSLMSFECHMGYTDDVKGLISNSLKSINMPIRDCQNIINELNIICNETDSNGVKRSWFYWYPLIIYIILLVKRINNEIYCKYFLKTKQEIYNRDIELMETEYKKFSDDIKGTKIEKVLNCLLESEGLGQTFIIHLINCFVCIRDVKMTTLTDYTGLTESHINQIMFGNGRIGTYPQTINSIIEKAHIFNFNN